MDSFAMVAASAEGQWRGLSEHERTTLTAHWAAGCLTSASVLKANVVAQRDQPIWSVVHAGVCQCVTLMSCKSDWISDVPMDAKETP